MNKPFKSLCLAFGLVLSVTVPASGFSLFPEDPVGSLDYNFIQGTYQYLDLQNGNGNGVGLVGSFELADSHFFLRSSVSFSETTFEVPSFYGSGSSEISNNSTFVDFGAGYYIPVAPFFHVVGEFGGGVNFSEYDNTGFLRGSLYVRLLTLGIIELNGGGVLSVTENNTTVNPTYGLHVNISKTFRVIARVELEEQYDRYEIGLRYSW
jgi:hypothetical protein